jgi:hypothetical protein
MTYCSYNTHDLLADIIYKKLLPNAAALFMTATARAYLGHFDEALHR